MAKYREIPCRHYIAYKQCTKGRKAEHVRLCQHCAKYEPRAGVHSLNRKKQYIDKIKRKETV